MEESLANARNIDDPNVGRFRGFSEFIKRQVDIVVALFLIVASLPLMGIIALAIATDGGPVLYRHKRIGRSGKAFDCLKFRTMILGADQCLREYLIYNPAAAREWEVDQKLRFDPRITVIGDVLRRLSFDELPQLFNVLGGSMSLVGPRPVTKSELVERYGSSAQTYLLVRPGITGLWQVSGRNEVNYKRRIQLDCEYVRRRSFWLDLVILLRTFRVVVSQAGAR